MKPNYYKEFVTSKIHAGFGVGLAAAFASASPIFFMVALAAYTLAWIYLPTSKSFTDKVDGKLDQAEKLRQQEEIFEFENKRRLAIGRLTAENRARYSSLAHICLEVVGNDPGNAMINGKLQDLMWTFLKMLSMQQGIEQYLAETDETKIQKDLAAIENELTGLREQKDKERLITSKESLRDVLAQHQKSIHDAKENLQVLGSELTRLEHQIQLLRADAIANRNSDVLSAKINASVETLQETKSILKTMSSVEDLISDAPPQSSDLGFGMSSNIPAMSGVHPQQPPPLGRATIRKQEKA